MFCDQCGAQLAAAVRTMRKAGHRSLAVWTESGARACEAGWDFVDGILGSACGGRRDRSSGIEAGDRADRKHS